MPKETRGFKWGTALLVLAVIIELFILAAIGARGATPTPTPAPPKQAVMMDTKFHVVQPASPPSTATSCDLDFTGRKVCGLGFTTPLVPQALTRVNDTNVTLTLGGSPLIALLAPTSLTLGWTGTLAADRLNSNVVQGVTNDTNVTGSIAAQNLTLGWTGQLGLSRGGTGKDFSGVTDGQIPIGKTSDHSLNLATITQGTGISVTNGAGTITIANSGVVTATHAATFVCDGYGSVLTSGTKAYVKIPYGGTLQGWTLVGSPSGSITVDIYRAADGAGLPVTSIVGGGGTKPALSTAVENSSTSFTGWTSTTLNAKDNLAIAISGVTATTYVALTLYYQ